MRVVPHVLTALVVVMLGLWVNNAAQAMPAHAGGWRAVAQCETGRAWRYNGPSGFDGGLQFLPSTWRAYARHGRRARRYAYAYQAPWWVQMSVAERVRKRSGLGQWPHCGRRWYA